MSTSENSGFNAIALCFGGAKHWHSVWWLIWHWNAKWLSRLWKVSHINFIYFNRKCLYFYWLILERRREKETLTCYSAYLRIHSLIFLCALTGDQTFNLRKSGQCFTKWPTQPGHKLNILGRSSSSIKWKLHFPLVKSEGEKEEMGGGVEGKRLISVLDLFVKTQIFKEELFPSSLWSTESYYSCVCLLCFGNDWCFKRKHIVGSVLKK